MSGETQRARPKVIIADDEKVIADTLAAIMNRSGFQAEAVYCGETAIQRAREIRADIIVSDVVMPGISGIEVAIQIRSILPHCKVLLFSGQAATTDVLEQAKAKGYTFEILAKPVHPADLLARVTSAESGAA
jgi:CheY-like chemotaxis protein